MLVAFRYELGAAVRPQRTTGGPGRPTVEPAGGPGAVYAGDYAVAVAVIACNVRTVVSMSWRSNWLSSRTEGPLMYSRRL